METEEKLRLEAEKKRRDLAEQEVSLHDPEILTDCFCVFRVYKRLIFTEIGSQNERT